MTDVTDAMVKAAARVMAGARADEDYKGRDVQMPPLADGTEMPWPKVWEMYAPMARNAILAALREAEPVLPEASVDAVKVAMRFIVMDLGTPDMQVFESIIDPLARAAYVAAHPAAGSAPEGWNEAIDAAAKVAATYGDRSELNTDASQFAAVLAAADDIATNIRALILPADTAPSGKVGAWNEAIEAAALAALKERCVRGTDWDLACTTIADQIRALIKSEA